MGVILGAQAALCRGLANSSIVHLDRLTFRLQHQWLKRHCEPYAFRFVRGGQHARYIADDPAATGLSHVLKRVRARGGLIYLSGARAESPNRGP